MSHSERVVAARADDATAVVECRSLYPYCMCACALVRQNERTLFCASMLDIRTREQLASHEVRMLDEISANRPSAVDHVIILNFERWARRNPAATVEQCLLQLRELKARLTFVERHRTFFLAKPHPTGVARVEIA